MLGGTTVRCLDRHVDGQGGEELLAQPAVDTVAEGNPSPASLTFSSAPHPASPPHFIQ